MRALEQLLIRINAPSYRPGRVARLGEFADRWKVEIVSKRKPLTQKAAESHGHHIFPYLGNLRLDSLGVENQQMFITYLTARVHSRKTVLNILGTLPSMLTIAKKWAYICEPVSMEDLVLPERAVQKESRSFTPDETRQILAAVENPMAESRRRRVGAVRRRCRSRPRSIKCSETT